MRTVCYGQIPDSGTIYKERILDVQGSGYVYSARAFVRYIDPSQDQNRIDITLDGKYHITVGTQDSITAQNTTVLMTAGISVNPMSMSANTKSDMVSIDCPFNCEKILNKPIRFEKSIEVMVDYTSVYDRVRSGGIICYALD